MRILQICSARTIGGGERHVIDLSNELASRGHDMFLAAVPDSPLIERLSSVPRENCFAVPLRNALDVSSARRMARFVREHNVELINAHLAKDYTMAAAAYMFSGVPFVITRHVLFPMSRLHRLLLRNARFVIAVSNAVADNLRREKIFREEKIVTVRYGVHSSGFHVEHREHEGFCVGTIGNLDPVKGIDVFVEAASKVIERMPGVSFEIVGEDRASDGRNEKNVRQLIAKLGLEGIVELRGWSDKIAETLAGFDLFVSASRSESFGFVIAEAMLAGVPVIATETAGANEIIGDVPLGMLVPLESPDVLADAIVDLLNDEPKRRQLAKFSRRHIEEHFSIDRMVNETLAVYERAIRPA